MKHTVYDRLLKREIGHQRRTYADVRGIYGDKRWVDDLDIVNELEGHNGCVNALRQLDTLTKLYSMPTDYLLAGRDLAASLPPAQMTIESTFTRTILAQTRSSSA